MPEQVREEVTPFFTPRLSIAIADNDSEKIEKLSEETVERIRSDLEVSLCICQCHITKFLDTEVIETDKRPFGVQPRWGDIDANQHVNNVKYIGWILEVICKLIKLKTKMMINLRILQKGKNTW